jgi:hypothetical protein
VAERPTRFGATHLRGSAGAAGRNRLTSPDMGRRADAQDRDQARAAAQKALANAKTSLC